MGKTSKKPKKKESNSPLPFLELERKYAFGPEHIYKGDIAVEYKTVFDLAVENISRLSVPFVRAGGGLLIAPYPQKTTCRTRYYLSDEDLLAANYGIEIRQDRDSLVIKTPAAEVSEGGTQSRFEMSIDLKNNKPITNIGHIISRSKEGLKFKDLPPLIRKHFTRATKLHQMIKTGSYRHKFKYSRKIDTYEVEFEFACDVGTATTLNGLHYDIDQIELEIKSVKDKKGRDITKYILEKPALRALLEEALDSEELFITDLGLQRVDGSKATPGMEHLKQNKSNDDNVVPMRRKASGLPSTLAVA